MEHSDINMGKPLIHDIEYLIETNTEGIIGLEAATAYWGLSTFNPNIPILMIVDLCSKDNGYYCELGAIKMFFAPDINTDNIVKLSDTLSVTDKEQTVCDMIRYNRHEFHLFETVLNAYEGEVDIDRLERLAKNYNILDKLHEIYNEALETEMDG